MCAALCFIFFLNSDQKKFYFEGVSKVKLAHFFPGFPCLLYKAPLNVEMRDIIYGSNLQAIKVKVGRACEKYVTLKVIPTTMLLLSSGFSSFLSNLIFSQVLASFLFSSVQVALAGESDIVQVKFFFLNLWKTLSRWRSGTWRAVSYTHLTLPTIYSV